MRQTLINGIIVEQYYVIYTSTMFLFLNQNYVFILCRGGNFGWGGAGTWLDENGGDEAKKVWEYQDLGTLQWL